MWWLVTTAWAGSTATLTWNPDGSRLFVNAPAGEELSADGPARLAVAYGDTGIAWTGTGRTLGSGVSLGDLRGETVAVLGTVTSCRHDTGVCRPWAVEATLNVPDRKKGTLDAEIGIPKPKPTPYPADAGEAATAAFDDARAANKPVLLDFGAVWCSPCNLLAAEVLDAEPPAPELDGVVIATLDVDDPSSFALKDRYAIGGYPTVIVAREDGMELARIVGYPGRDAFLAWVAASAALDAPPPDPAGLDPAAADPKKAAEIAWDLVEAGRTEEAARWVPHGDTGTADLRLARFATGKDPAVKAQDAAWLAENAPGHARAWALGAVDAAPEIQAAARDAIDHDLRDASGPEAADLLGLRAELVADAEAPAWASAALAALRTSLTGDPERDRGHFTYLADLMAQSGDLDGAVAFLDAQAARWTEEPTFDLASARLLNEAGRFADAKARATRAMDRSWGDNHLRVVAQLCTALVGLGDAPAAAAAAKKALADAPPVAADQKVRTFRYRTALEKFTTSAP